MTDSPNGAKIDAVMIARVQRYMLQVRTRFTPSPETAVAWRTFFAVCDGLIRRYAAVDGVRAADLEDCVQEVWTYLTDHLPTFEFDPHRGRFETWLYTIVRSKAVDQARRRGRRQRGAAAVASMADPRPGPVDPAVSVERCDAIAGARRMLDRIQRHVSRENYELVRMRWLDELSVAETARKLGITSEQVWYREHRVRKKLRRMLGDEWAA